MSVRHGIGAVVATAVFVLVGLPASLGHADSPSKGPCPGTTVSDAANFHGSLTGDMLGDDRVVDLDMTQEAAGYYLATEGGSVYAFGDARWLGSPPPEVIGDERVIELFPLPPVDSLGGCPSPYTGYLLVTDHGNVHPFGSASSCGSIAPTDLGVQRVVAFEPVWDGGCGYRLVTDAGNVYAFGRAPWCGSVPGGTQAGDRVIAVAPGRGGCGYRIFTEHGHVYALGGARWLGSIRAGQLGGQRVVDVFSEEFHEPTFYGPALPGYVLFTDAGNTYAFGSLSWPGSYPTDEPIVTADVDKSWNGLGYRLYGSRGGVFAIDCADFDGSAWGLLAPEEQVVATETYLDVGGYMIVTDRGHVYAFDDWNRGTCHRFPGDT